jgi:hypothetical protein
MAYKPGDTVTESGVYRVVHDPRHREVHEVTCIAGKKFPPCNGCDHPRFALVRRAKHITQHISFK